MRLVSALLAALFLAGCAGSSGTGSNDDVVQAVVDTVATPTVTATPTVVPTPTPTAAPTVTPAATPTAAPTVTPTPAQTVTPTATVVATATAAPSATPTVPPSGAAGSAEPAPTGDPAAEVKPDKTLPPTDYTGPVRAIRTQNGLMLTVRGVSNGVYEVVTPCFELGTVRNGLAIEGPLDVLIDPGHGGDETGAVGPNGLKESTVNLRVAELTRAELLERGYRVELTRYSDHRMAIQARTELANALRPAVFVSIHHNGGYPEPFPRAATEIFVQQNDAESSRLGGLLFEEIQRAFADVDIDWMGNAETFGVAWRQNRAGSDLYGILRRTPDLVTVLTEAMFISTAAEAELLAKPETAVTEARAIAEAIDRYFTSADPGSGFTDGVVFQGDLGTGGGTEGCVDPPL